MLLSLSLSFLCISVNQHHYRNISFLSLSFLHIAQLLISPSSLFQSCSRKKTTQTTTPATLGKAIQSHCPSASLPTPKIHTYQTTEHEIFHYAAKSMKVSCLPVLSSTVCPTPLSYRDGVPPWEAQKPWQGWAGLGSDGPFFPVPSRQKGLEGALLFPLSIEDGIWLWKIWTNFPLASINEELEGSQVPSCTATED